MSEKTIRKTAGILMLIVMVACLLLSAGCRAEDRSAETSEPAGSAKLEEIKERGVLKVGSTGDYIPMSYLDPETGRYEGFDAELAEDLADSLGVSIEYVKTSWPTLMEDTLAGKFDLAVCGITVTDERKEQALMSEARRMPADIQTWMPSTGRRCASWRTPVDSMRSSRARTCRMRRS